MPQAPPALGSSLGATAGSTDPNCAGVPTTASVKPDASKITGTATRWATQGYQSGPYFYTMDLKTPGYDVASVNVEGHEFKVDGQAGGSGNLSLALGGDEFSACRNFIVADVNLTDGSTVHNQVVKVGTTTSMNTDYWDWNQPGQVESRYPGQIAYSGGQYGGVFTPVTVYGSGATNKVFPAVYSDMNPHTDVNNDTVVQVPGQMAGGWVTIRPVSTGFDGTTGAPWTHAGDPVSVFVMGENDSNVPAETNPALLPTQDTSPITGTFERKGTGGTSGSNASGYEYDLAYDPHGLSVASLVIHMYKGDQDITAPPYSTDFVKIDPNSATKGQHISLGTGRVAVTGIVVDYTLTDGTVVKGQQYLAAGTGRQMWWLPSLNFQAAAQDNGGGQLLLSANRWLNSDLSAAGGWTLYPVKISLSDGTQLDQTTIPGLDYPNHANVQVPGSLINGLVSLQPTYCPTSWDGEIPHCYFGDATAKWMSDAGDYSG